ncbi:MAG: hypothetical protein ACREDR_03795, partial [Blastocatellia bacterium]
PEAFRFEVKHKQVIRDEKGTLTISEGGIEYRTSSGGHDGVWTYDDIRQIKVASPKELDIETYENRKRDLTRHRNYKFFLLDGSIDAKLARLLLEKSARPMVTSVVPASEGGAVFGVNVKHLHTVGGCEGVLKIYPDCVIYESAGKKADSRFWRYSDIQSFGLIDRYRLEFTIYESTAGGLKSYNFELKRDLPSGLYNYVWRRVHPTAFTALRDGQSSGARR